VHLKALPGSPGYGGDRGAILYAALRDTEAWVEGGAHGVIVENFGDAPFFPGRVPAHTLAGMAAIGNEIRRQCPVPLGFNVLRNDGVSALALAAAVGAEFIRVNILCGARLTDQGVIQGIAHDLLRDRSALDADAVAVLADVNVKHSAPLAPYDLSQEVEDACRRGGAAAVVVTGSGTGKGVDLEELRTVKRAAGEAPVLVGSGVTPESLEELAAVADGFIVGTAAKTDGRVENPVDKKRVAELVGLLR
jgi:membrane complex biogenesis BtpA family protein